MLAYRSGVLANFLTSFAGVGKGGLLFKILAYFCDMNTNHGYFKLPK